MARAYCTKCQRPASVCICHLFTAVANDVELVVLQHPKEVNHPKGTVNLLTNSLKNTQTFVGENFDQHQEFQDFLNNTSRQLCVLYPDPKALDITTFVNSGSVQSLENITLIVLDGTWKKVYKMYQLSSGLQQLKCLRLPEGVEGKYLIRKTTKKAALSTLEASCLALGLLENSPNKYDELVKSFAQLNQIQLSFRK
ncbi:tRNA-uridine aminocarboxypropyltransferase [Colwellia sp. MEBiC06753]